MKKTIILIIAGLLSISCFVACTDNFSSSGYGNDYYDNEVETFTVKEMEELAKVAVVEKISDTFMNRYIDGAYAYDVTYKFTNISANSISDDGTKTYYISGKLTTWDKYDDYLESYVFDATIEVNQTTGNTSFKGFDYKKS